MLDEHEHAPLVIAHRATMGHAAENTLAGIRAGIAMGVDGVEVDERTQHLETYITLSQTAGVRFPIKLLRNGEKVVMQIRSVRQRYRK